MIWYSGNLWFLYGAVCQFALNNLVDSNTNMPKILQLIFFSLGVRFLVFGYQTRVELYFNDGKQNIKGAFSLHSN